MPTVHLYCKINPLAELSPAHLSPMKCFADCLCEVQCTKQMYC